MSMNEAEWKRRFDAVPTWMKDHIVKIAQTMRFPSHALVHGRVMGDAYREVYAHGMEDVREYAALVRVLAEDPYILEYASEYKVNWNE